MKKLTEEQYPPQLREIPDIPKQLYLEGSLPEPDCKLLCVIGSRVYSDYGRKACEKLIMSLAGKKVSIVSGLALGIDTFAHEAALSAGLHTLALPGSGLDPSVIHPHRNVRLAERIVAAGGGLLSEYEPDFKATPWSFPRRNRIMAGLSHTVLVIEAGEKSGTLITSKLATDYNRDVCALPGSIFSKTSFGPHMLIRLGAIPITKVEDLHEALGFETFLPLTDTRLADCTPAEISILDLLSEPRTRDEIMSQSGLSVSDAQIALSLLEIKGFIEEKTGLIRSLI